MVHLFVDRALLPAGWAQDVRIAVSPDGTIAAIEEDAAPRGADRVDGVAVPGVPNLHSHAFQRGLAGLTERGSPGGDTFWSWRERMYAFVDRLGPDDVEAIAAQAYVEMLRHGFTSVAEFHYLRNAPDGRPYDDPVEMGRRVLAAADASGIGLTLLPVLYTAAGFDRGAPSDARRRFTASVSDLVGDVAVLAEAGAQGSTRTGLALHSLRAVRQGDLTVAVDAMRAIDPAAPIHIHVAEQEREVEECLAWSGARPVEWLLDHAPVDDRWCLVHATHVEEREIEGIAASGATVGLCPSTEANLGDGVFPFADFAERRGSWGVGTDANVSTSPVSELRTLEYGQRLVRRARNVAAGAADRSTARTLLEAAYAGGARACGRPVGTLAVGSRADVVFLDSDHPALLGREGDDLLDSWIFSGDDTPVRHVMVDGRWVVRDGRHARQEAVYEAYRAAAARLGREGSQLSLDLEG